MCGWKLVTILSVAIICFSALVSFFGYLCFKKKIARFNQEKKEKQEESNNKRFQDILKIISKTKLSK